MATDSVFELTERPNPSLFFHRDDPNDPRLGETTQTQLEYYVAAKVILLGCPQDMGVARNRGRAGAAKAPDAIRTCLYRLPATITPLFDLGDTRITDSLEETHQLHRLIVEQVLRDGKKLIVLGGGNDISYPDCAALSTVYPATLAFNIDAHFDVRADNPANSGTPYRQLLEEGFLHPVNFYEMGSVPFSNAAVYTDYLLKKGVNIYPLELLQAEDTLPIFKNILHAHTTESIFWGFDVDAVNLAAAPGVSAPNPLGFSAAEFCQLARLAGSDPRTRIIEFSEVNPQFDIDQRTSRLVAAAIHYFLSVIA